MAKIQYCSDLHLEFADNWRYLKQNPLEVSGDILILAGDIGYLGDDNYSVHPFWDWVSDNYEQVIVALGNHEFYKSYDISTLEDGACFEIRDNVKAYYNSVVKINDIDIIVSTLWAYIPFEDAYYTEQCISDFRRIQYRGETLTSTDFNREHQRCKEFVFRAVKESDAAHKIVVSHHVPSFLMLSPEFKGSKANGAFTVELFNEICDSNIDYWIYGHSHRNIDCVIGKTRCISNQLGYVAMEDISSFDRAKYIEL